jgi:hypothetical protein
MAEREQNVQPGPDMAEVDDRADARVPWRVFAGVGLVIAVIAGIYLATADERAGAVMLVLAAALALWLAVFLWSNLRRFEAGGTGEPAGDDVYLPESSPWPFGVGLGVTLVLNGLLIGTWFLVPGVFLLGLSLAGWGRQSRWRS